MSETAVFGPGVNLNLLNERQAMGLPNSYVSPGIESLGDSARALRAMAPGELAALVEDVAAPLATRLTAGFLLGLIGDPRIDTFNPTMLTVPGGMAIIGLKHSDIEEEFRTYQGLGIQRTWIAKEAPQFSVAVAPFRIAKYCVTNAEYRDFLKDSGWPEIPTAWHLGAVGWGRDNHPVCTVSAAAADAYANWLAQRTGRAFRLPTEIEWEYAAAGPRSTRFPWGDEFKLDAANTQELRLLSTTPVGCFPAGASWVGALDMAGNVEEYVQDTYSPYPGGELVEDDLYLKLGHYRIARGGAFNRFRDLARCKRRHGPYPSSLYFMGIRLVEDLRV